MVVVILSYYNKGFLHLHTLASCQALRKGEGEGKESLVATVCACADFSAILRNPDTCLYMSATLNVMGQSIWLLVFCSVVLFAIDLCFRPRKAGPYGSVSQVGTVRIHSCAFPRAMARVYVIRLFLSSRTSAWLCRLLF